MSISTKIPAGILIELYQIYWSIWEKTDSFTMLSFLIHEHGIALHSLSDSLISFVFDGSQYMFVHFISYFIFKAIKNGIRQIFGFQFFIASI